jgi:hypothetical protein
VNLVEEYDERFLYNMLLKYNIICHHYLHPMEKSEVGCVEQVADEDFHLDIFERIVHISETMFHIVDFLAHEILSIIES